MLSLYALCNHGISLNIVSNLVNQGLTISDFRSDSDAISEIRLRKPKLFNDIKTILPELNNEEIENNIYQLFHGSLSGKIIQSLMELNIKYEDLPGLTLEAFNRKVGASRESTFMKIMNAYEAIEDSKGRSPYRIIKAFVAQNISDLGLDESITIAKLRELTYLKFGSTTNIFQSILSELYEEGKFNYNSIGIQKATIKLMDYLDSDFKDKEIFMERISGKALAEIAKVYGYSRQGIYNIESRVIRRMPEFEEDIRYRDLFQLYNFEPDLFLLIFNEPPEVYNYLNYKYDKGGKSLLTDFDKDLFSDEQYQKVLQYHNQFINSNGELTTYSKSTIFDEVVSRYATDFVQNEDLIDRYNEYVQKNNIPDSFLVDESSIRGLSDRSDMVIRDRNLYYRFYDFETISDFVKEELKNLLQLDIGFYSMRKVFAENKELMNEIDIRSENELHNLYKRLIKIENVTYRRMPEFSVGDMNKKEFILRVITELSPIQLTDLLEFIEENYGLRKDSLSSFITSELSEYMHDNILKVDYLQLSNEELGRMASLLKEPIYTFEQVQKKGAEIDPNFAEKFINNMNLSKLGYTLRSNYILRNDYPNVDRYFNQMILSRDYFTNDHSPLYNSQSFNRVVTMLEKNFELVKVEKDMYITSKKLREVEITTEDFLSYRKAILEVVDDDKYFTLYSLREMGFVHPLEDLGFEDIFYERLIWAFDGISTARIDSGYIFSITENIISQRDFIYSEISKRRIVDLYDLLEEINSEYDVKLEEYKVLSLIKDTEIYYSKELYKFYIDIDDYYEEVYE